MALAHRKSLILALVAIMTIPLAAGAITPGRIAEPVLPDDGAFDATPTYVRVLVGLALEKIERAELASDSAAADADLRQAHRMVAAAHALASSLPDGSGASMAAALAPAKAELDAARTGEPSNLAARAAASRSAVLQTKLASEDPVRDLLLSPPATVWTSENDGHGSGLDADTLDGFHAADILAWIASEADARGEADRLLREALDAEIAAREAADAALNARIDQEIADRRASDDAERAAREAADADLNDRVDAEVTDREAGDAALNARVDRETADRVAGDDALRAALDAEAAARRAADDDLQRQLDDEVAARIAAVAAEEQARIDGDALLRMALDEEIAAREAAIADLQQQLDEERDARIAADAALRAAVDQETADRMAADAAEAAARMAADESERDARIADVADLQQQIDDEVAARVAAVAAEEQSRIDGDAMLRLALDEEIAAREAAVADLQAQLDQLRADLTAETASREAEDARLDGRIDDESAARTAADAALRAALDEETAARIAADEDLQRQLDDEVAARIAAVAAEEQARIDGDALLRMALDEEIAAREAAIADLQAQIDSLRADLTAESSTRASEDARIDGRIDDEIAARENAISDLQSQLDAEIAARTAAVAAEAQTRADADSLLRAALDQEIAAREAAIADVLDRLRAEVDARVAADDALRASLDTESATRASADDALDARIDDLTQAQQDGDAALRAALDQEIADRIAGDAALRDDLTYEANVRANQDDIHTGRIDAEVAARIAGDLAERNARVAAINALSNRLDREIADREQAVEQEALLRADGDTLLRMALDEEIAARIAAVLELREALDQEIAARVVEDDALRVALQRENADRLAAESEIRNTIRLATDRITALEGFVRNGRYVGESIELTGLASFGGPLTVGGTTTLNDAATVNAAFRVNGVSTLNGAVDVNGASTLNGATSIVGTLGVSDAIRTDSTLTTGGSATIGNGLTVQSGDLLIDGVSGGVSNALRFRANPWGGGADLAKIFVEQDVTGTERTSLVLQNNNDGPGAAEDNVRLRGANVFVEPNALGGGHLRVSGDLAFGGTMTSGTVPWARLDSYPSCAPASPTPVITGLGDSIACTSDYVTRTTAQTITGAKVFDGGPVAGSASFFGSGSDLSFTGGTDDIFYLNNIGAVSGRTSISHMDAELLSVENTGEVGIGTNAPARRLDVAGTGRFTGLLEATNGVAVTGGALTVTSVPAGAAGAVVNKGADNNPAILVTSSSNGHGSGVHFENLLGRKYSAYSNSLGEFVIGDETVSARAATLTAAGAAFPGGLSAASGSFTGAVTASRVNVGKDVAGGLHFPANAYGGAFDQARLYVTGTGGENTQLTIESENDPGDTVMIRAGKTTLAKNGGGAGNVLISDGSLGIRSDPFDSGIDLHVKGASGDSGDIMLESANGRRWDIVSETDGRFLLAEVPGAGVYNTRLVLSPTGDLSFTGTLTGGAVPWERLTAFPASCAPHSVATAVGPSLTCTSDYATLSTAQTIAGAKTFTSDVRVAGADLVLTSAAPTGADIQSDGGSDSVFGIANTGAASGRTAFVSGGAEHVVIENTGDVGIGTSDPARRLDVAGAVRATTLEGDGALLTNLDAGNVASGTLADARLSSNVVLRDNAQTISGAKTFTSAPTLQILGDALILQPAAMGTGQKTSILFADPTPGTGPVRITYVDDGSAGLGVMGGSLGVGTENPGRTLDVVGSARANTFEGDGALLTNLNAANVASGTLSDARLSSNVPLKNAANTFTNTNTFAMTRLSGANSIEFGSGVTKQMDAGKIGYETFSGNALDIVGSGTVAGSRRIQLWEDVVIAGTAADVGSLDVDGPASADSIVSRGSIEGVAISGSTITTTSNAAVGGNLALTGTLTAGTVPWARLASFPAGCASGFVTAVGASLTCSTDGAALQNVVAVDLTCANCIGGVEIDESSLATVPSATTATQLTADGANCAPGEFATGVDALGAAQGCAVPAGPSNMMTTNTPQTITGAKIFDGGSAAGLASFFGLGPDLSFTGGQDSHFYLNNIGAATGRTSIAYSNAELFSVENTGDVGIGTTNPTHKLEVVGTSRTTGLATFGSAVAIGAMGTLSTAWEDLLVKDTNNGIGDLAIAASNDERWNLAADGASALRFSQVTAAGAATDVVKFTKTSVGIVQMNPQRTLDVTGTGRFTGALDVGAALTATGLLRADGGLAVGGATSLPGIATEMIVRGGLNNPNADFLLEASNGERYNLASGTDGKFYLADVNPAGTVYTNRIVIDGAGDVGLGVEDPLYRLDVGGDVRWAGDLVGGNVPWARVTSFPAACGTGSFVRGVDTSLTCASYTAGTGLVKSGDTFSISSDVATLSGSQTFSGAKTFSSSTRMTPLGDALVLQPTAMSGGQKTSIVFADPDFGTGAMRLSYLDDGSAGLGVMGGNFGIGTDDPGRTLDVVGTARASLFEGNGASLTNLNAGNVASGTLPDARLTSNVALLSAAQTFTATKSFSGGLFMVGSTLALAPGAGSLAFSNDMDSGMGSISDGTFMLRSNGAERLRVMTTGTAFTGLVGIGTTSPVAPLSISQNSAVTPNGLVLRGTSAGHAQIQLDDLADGSAGQDGFLMTFCGATSIGCAGQANAVEFNLLRAGDMNFYTGGVERLKLTAAGDAFFAGHLFTHGTHIGGDVAEPTVPTSLVEAGDVVVMDGKDATGKLQIKRADTDKSRKVVGVVSTAPSITLAGLPTDTPLAVTGIVPVKVLGPIELGDLLVSSSTPGVARACGPSENCFGSVIGKALDAYSGEGVGRITVLVTLG